MKDRLSSWSRDESRLYNNIGPVIDFKKHNDSILCVAGLAPNSGLYEIKKGLHYYMQTQLDFNLLIDKVWFLQANSP